MKTNENKLSENIKVTSTVTVNFAGTKRVGKVTVIRKDRSSAKVSFGKGGGLPLWYPADSISEGDTKKAKKKDKTDEAVDRIMSSDNKEAALMEEIADILNEKEPVSKAAKKRSDKLKEAALPKVPQGIIDAAAEAAKPQDVKVETVEDEPKEEKKFVELTVQQNKMFTIVKQRKSIEATELAAEMIITKIQLASVGMALVDKLLVDVNVDAGVYTYSITKTGAKLPLDDIKLPPARTKRGVKKEAVLTLISEGKTNKEIVLEVGCDPAYVSDMRSMLYIKEKDAELSKELSNEEFAKEVGKSLYLVNLFRK